MAKKIVTRVDRNLARRLREARQETRLSTRAVADRLPRRLKVSHNTIALYERGAVVPPVDVLAALATLYGRSLNWFLENRESLSGWRYRNLKSRVGVRDKRQFEALTGKWVDGYINLERHLNCPLRRRSGGIDVAPEIPATVLAAAFRHHLGLEDSDPIQNVIELLEQTCAVRVLEMRTKLPIDGVAALHGDDPIVVLNPATANDRVRMNAAHELAHALYGDCKASAALSDDAIEKRAYEFASSLLIPDSQLERAFEGRSFLKLIQYKERFGVSVAAMIYRAERRKIIRTTTARWLWIEMTKRGMRTNEPGYVWRDRAIRFETILESAIQTKTISWETAERVTGITEDDLRRRLEEATQPLDVSPSEGGELEETELKQGILKFTPRTESGED